MTEFERFALALAWTESNNVEQTWGDAKGHFWPSDPKTPGIQVRDVGKDFMAVGRWQMHPAWYAEWADPAIQVGWSWDEAFRAALRRFWDEYQRLGMTLEYIVLAFHLGASAVARGDTDAPYLLRFKKFWDAQTTESKA